MIEHRIEHLFSFNATLGTRHVVGPVGEGIRLNVYVTGGEVTGPKIQGKVLPVGGDWLTIRRDGMAVLDVRATFETHDGALIYVVYYGLTDFGEDGYENFLKGEVSPDPRPLRICPRLSSSHSHYLWVNRTFCFGVGQSFPERQEVAYDVYRVS